MSNPIESIILQHGANDKVIFVFPSDIAASLWLEKALDITKRNTLPSDRFIAWDRFKEQAMQASAQNLQAVSKIIRKLYAQNIAEKNAQATSPFFTDLIQKEYAAESLNFAPWIARILPQLSLLKNKIDKAHNAALPHKHNLVGSNNAMCKDLLFLSDDYEKFLLDHDLFEPSWQRPLLKDEGLQFFILFPEAIEDYAEYASILAQAQFITNISTPVFIAEPKDRPKLFQTSREELRACALQIEALISKGVPLEHIAISVPKLETFGPYLTKELFLRGIPFEYRAGIELGKHSAGRLFALIESCVNSNFAFSDAKALLLNQLIPWKGPEGEQLIEFGIRNHCVTSWTDKGKFVDVWDEAFKTPTKGEKGDDHLKEWFKLLKKDLQAMVRADSFSNARIAYILFREHFLDMAQLDERDDAVIARCIEELKNLCSLEKEFSFIMPKKPWSFFVKHLNETSYVPQRTQSGISIFPYRVAAGIPFPFHFVLNASMEDASVSYRELSFLREDLRDEFRAFDTDASSTFFSLYHCSPLTSGYADFSANVGVSFSVSAQTFLGYSTMHSFFMQNSNGVESQDTLEDSVSFSEDPYLAERDWLLGKREFPQRLYPLQKKSFFAYQSYENGPITSYLYQPLLSSTPLLQFALLKKHYENKLPKISATSLNNFSFCNSYWFLNSVLTITEDESDASLPNERNLGNVYHSVLHKVYERIKKTDQSFKSANLETYIQWAKEFSEQSTAAESEFSGPLAAPLLESLSKRVAEGVSEMLKLDASLLDGFIPEILEQWFSFEYNNKYFVGKIDRISRRATDNELVLIDYKSGRVPTKSLYTPNELGLLGDYQMPMYLFIVEQDPKTTYKHDDIQHAWYGNIKTSKYNRILSDPNEIPVGSREKVLTREEFKPCEEAFNKMCSIFVQALSDYNFTRPPHLSYSSCATCSYNKICRILYSVRP